MGFLTLENNIVATQIITLFMWVLFVTIMICGIKRRGFDIYIAVACCALGFSETLFYVFVITHRLFDFFPSLHLTVVSRVRSLITSCLIVAIATVFYRTRRKHG